MNRRYVRECFSGLADFLRLLRYGGRFCSICCAPYLVPRISLAGWFVDRWRLAFFPADGRKNGQGNSSAWLVAVAFVRSGARVDRSGDICCFGTKTVCADSIVCGPSCDRGGYGNAPHGVIWHKTPSGGIHCAALFVGPDRNPLVYPDP